jgi:hypothetical protein
MGDCTRLLASARFVVVKHNCQAAKSIQTAIPQGRTLAVLINVAALWRMIVPQR